MFTFANIAGVNARIAGTADNGKHIVLVTLPGVSTGKQARAALVAAGYKDDEPKRHNFVWGGQELGGYKRHFADKSKAEAVVKAINDAHAPAPKKSTPKKATPKKAAPKAEDPAAILAQIAELNARLAALLAK